MMSASVPTMTGLDGAAWKQTEDGNFTVSSCYLALCKRYSPYGLFIHFNYVDTSVWKVDALLNVKTFGARCFINRIPIKDLLACRGILPFNSNLDCVFCEDFAESLGLSFLTCRKVEVVWMKWPFG